MVQAVPFVIYLGGKRFETRQKLSLQEKAMLEADLNGRRAAFLKIITKLSNTNDLTIRYPTELKSDTKMAP